MTVRTSLYAQLTDLADRIVAKHEKLRKAPIGDRLIALTAGLRRLDKLQIHRPRRRLP